MVNKAYGTHVLTGQGMKYKCCYVMLQLHKTSLRTHLIYSLEFWSLQYGEDVGMLESDERRLTRMLPKLKDFSYKERRYRLGLISLEGSS